MTRVHSRTTAIAAVSAFFVVAAAGCSSSSRGPSTGPQAAQSSQSVARSSAKPSPPASANPAAASGGLPKDVCTAMPLARVNQLTGLDLTIAQVVPPQGQTAAECQYMNAATAVNASTQINALVATGSSIDALWNWTTKDSGQSPPPLNGVGKRAVAGDGVVAVDYGTFLVVVDDWASTDDQLGTDQLRFLADELHNLYK